jgi:hypothetical protein
VLTSLFLPSLLSNYRLCMFKAIKLYIGLHLYSTWQWIANAFYRDRTALKDLKGTWFEDLDWIYLAEDMVHWQTVVNTVTNVRVVYNAENFLTRWTSVSFWRRAVFHKMDEYTLKFQHRASVCPSIARNKENLKRSGVCCPCHVYDVLLYLHFGQCLLVFFLLLHGVIKVTFILWNEYYYISG